MFSYYKGFRFLQLKGGRLVIRKHQTNYIKLKKPHHQNGDGVFLYTQKVIIEIICNNRYLVKI